MKLQPLHDWVLIRTGEPSGKSAGGIIIPDTAQEKPEEGEVLAVGTGRFVEDKDSKEKIKKKTFVKTTVKPGDGALAGKHRVMVSTRAYPEALAHEKPPGPPILDPRFFSLVWSDTNAILYLVRSRRRRIGTQAPLVGLTPAG